MKRGLLRFLALVLVGAGVLAAHDTWLVPALINSGPGSFRVTPGLPARVALHTSEDFPSSEAAAAPDRIARFEAVTADGRKAVSGYRVEDKSLVAEVVPGPGVTLVVAITHPRLIVMKPEDFQTYLSEEGLQAIVAARAARGQAQSEGRERYSKVAKLALCAGEVRGAAYEQPLGLRLEIVPENNPCELRVGEALRVRVLFDGAPLAGVWVGAGYSGVHGHHYPVWLKTDSAGRAAVRPDRPGAWFVRALHMVPSTEVPDADWQSWFSTFTFAVH
ncbi:MAG: DUF4198 domain-containing protein [Acidobacteria bacterium]|nr:DUF4198 domain-containing protein [Acidobacteriota bacterium]